MYMRREIQVGKNRLDWYGECQSSVLVTYFETSCTFGNIRPPSEGR